MLQPRQPRARSADDTTAVSSARERPPGMAGSAAAPHAVKASPARTSRSVCGHQPGAWDAARSAAWVPARAGLACTPAAVSSHTRPTAAAGPDLGPILIVAHAEHDDRLRP